MISAASDVAITLLDSAGLRTRRDDLRALLADAIESNASLGFLWPTSDAELDAFWDAVERDVSAGSRHCFAAIAGERLIGSVQLTPCGKPNQPHRADVQKLLVHRAHRHRGVGARLMQAVEAEALARGRTLLTLDTRTGSVADSLYRAWGWTPFGVVPSFALDPDGAMADCTFYYKHLAAVAA